MFVLSEYLLITFFKYNLSNLVLILSSTSFILVLMVAVTCLITHIYYENLDIDNLLDEDQEDDSEDDDDYDNDDEINDDVGDEDDFDQLEENIDIENQLIEDGSYIAIMVILAIFALDFIDYHI